MPCNGIRAQHARELTAVDLGEHDVEQHDARAAHLRERERVEPGAGFTYEEPERLEHEALGEACAVIVFDDEHRARRATAQGDRFQRDRIHHDGGGASSWRAGRTVRTVSGLARGSRSVNTEPLPTVLATVSWPCMPAANSRLIVRPRPVPPNRS